MCSSDLFFLDLDGDGTIGATAAATDRVGDQTLLNLSGSNQLAFKNGRRDAVPLRWGGGVLRGDDSRLPGWSPVAATILNGLVSLLWREATTGRLTSWSFDDSGNATGFTPIVTPSSDDAYALESSFSYDANGDRSVGNPYVPIASSGNASLLRHGSSHQLAFRSAGLNLNLSWGSAPLLDADPRLPDWSAIAAARLNGLPSLLWRQATTGNLATWSFYTNTSTGNVPVAPS